MPQGQGTGGQPPSVSAAGHDDSDVVEDPEDADTGGLGRLQPPAGRDAS
jgi:hypothetical protein